VTIARTFIVKLHARPADGCLFQAKKFMVNMNASASFIITKSPYMIRTDVVT
jgi:hypothetical protein